MEGLEMFFSCWMLNTEELSVNFIYSNLSPNDFEVLCQDVLSNIYGERFERFKTGKDAGIDLRLLNLGKEIIVQVKHCLGSYGSSHKTLLKKEFNIAKSRFTSGERYILITSLGLSPHNKSEIKKLSLGLIKRDDDIIGIDEIEDILTKHPEMVKRHYKLWISSTTVLTRLLNNGIYGKSEDYLLKIRSKVRLFVETKKFSEANDILTESNILLLTGDPGVGKTMLAEMLCLAFVGKEYSFVYADEIKEADDVFDKEEKQVFLLDDFLGSNYLEFIEGKIESKILRFMDRVQMYKNKKLILNSRTTIFNNALLKGIHLQDKSWSKFDCILEVKNYTNIEKAQILYNHLVFADLDDTYFYYIKDSRKYLDIVKHKNFNPRVIEFITSIDKIQGKVGEEYLEFVTNMLNNPASIWEAAYRNQINDEGKILVQSLFSLGGSAYESMLKDTFEKRLQTELQKSAIKTSDSPYNNSMKMLLDGFVCREVIKSGNYKLVKISFINPSVSDFMADYLKRNEMVANRIVESIILVEQMSKLIQAEVVADFKNNKTFMDMLKTTDGFTTTSYSNKYVAVLVMVFQNHISIDLTIMESILKKALSDNIRSYEIHAIYILFNNVLSSLKPSEIKERFPDSNLYIKFMLDGCVDLCDMKKVIKLAEKLGVDVQSSIEGDDEIENTIQKIVEMEADSRLNDDETLNSTFEASHVRQRLKELNNDIKDDLRHMGIELKYVVCPFDQADADEIAYKNLAVSAEADEGSLSKSSEINTGDSDIDIDMVFKA